MWELRESLLAGQSICISLRETEREYTSRAGRLFDHRLTVELLVNGLFECVVIVRS